MQYVLCRLVQSAPSSPGLVQSVLSRLVQSAHSSPGLVQFVLSRFVQLVHSVPVLVQSVLSRLVQSAYSSPGLVQSVLSRLVRSAYSSPGLVQSVLSRLDGIRLWRHILATGGRPMAWRQRREPWRLSLRLPQDRRAALQQGRKNPEAVQRRRRSRGPLRALSPEVWVAGPMEDSIPERRRPGRHAADSAAIFAPRRAVRRRGPSRRRRAAGFGWMAPAVQGLMWKEPEAAKGRRRRHLSANVQGVPPWLH